MSLIARARSWLRVSSRRADFEREMQDEMRTHLELYQADLSTASIEGVNFKGARYDSGTKWPGKPPAGTRMVKNPDI